MKSVEYPEVRFRKIENGYVLAWEKKEEGDDWGSAYIEFYAESLDAALLRLKTLYQGQ